LFPVVEALIKSILSALIYFNKSGLKKLSKFSASYFKFINIFLLILSS
jgi:hypothetical protein